MKLMKNVTCALLALLGVALFAPTTLALVSSSNGQLFDHADITALLPSSLGLESLLELADGPSLNRAESKALELLSHARHAALLQASPPAAECQRLRDVLQARSNAFQLSLNIDGCMAVGPEVNLTVLANDAVRCSKFNDVCRRVNSDFFNAAMKFGNSGCPLGEIGQDVAVGQVFQGSLFPALFEAICIEIDRGSHLAMDGCKQQDTDQPLTKNPGLADTRCCFDDSRSCVTPRPCFASSGVTFEQAEAICAAEGGRLCNAGELDDGRCCRTGCGFDSSLVWISDAPTCPIRRAQGGFLNTPEIVVQCRVADQVDHNCTPECIQFAEEMLANEEACCLLGFDNLQEAFQLREQTGLGGPPDNLTLCGLPVPLCDGLIERKQEIFENLPNDSEFKVLGGQEGGSLASWHTQQQRCLDQGLQPAKLTEQRALLFTGLCASLSPQDCWIDGEHVANSPLNFFNMDGSQFDPSFFTETEPDNAPERNSCVRLRKEDNGTALAGEAFDRPCSNSFGMICETLNLPTSAGTRDGCIDQNTFIPDEECLSTVTASNRRATRCCSDDGLTCTSTQCDASRQETYFSAVKRCASQGRRLCTKQELDGPPGEPGVCCSTGCGFDADRVWTFDSEECAASP